LYCCTNSIRKAVEFAIHYFCLLRSKPSLPQWRGGDSMRGKLRDKRITATRDISKRDGIERHRLAKRDNRSMVRLSLQIEDDDLEFDIEEEEGEEEGEEEAKIEVPQKKN